MMKMNEDNPADVLEVPCLSSCLGNGKRGGREIQIDNLFDNKMVGVQTVDREIKKYNLQSENASIGVQYKNYV